MSDLAILLRGGEKGEEFVEPEGVGVGPGLEEPLREPGELVKVGVREPDQAGERHLAAEPVVQPAEGETPTGDQGSPSRYGRSASDIAAADFQRSSGCFSSALRKTRSSPSGASGRWARSGTGGCSRTIW